MYDDILEAKDKLDNAIINHFDNVIKRSALEAKNRSLDPIQTYILIHENVEEIISNINYCLEPYSLNLSGTGEVFDKVTELMKPYNDAKEIEIKKRVDEMLNSETLYELFDRSQELSKLCNELDDLNPRDYVIKKTLK